MTIVPDLDFPIRYEITGRAAHISAASPGGPRYEPAMSALDRKSIANGIWLCADCADLIDKGRGRGFSKELLESWKQRAEQELANASLLRATAERPAWLDKLRTPSYVNLPRVLHLAGPNGLSPETAEMLKRGFPEGTYIRPQLGEVAHVLRRLSIKAVDVEQLVQPTRQVVEGLVVSFYRHCRTRNSQNTEEVKHYSFARSPLIYTDAHKFRYIFPYDPIWLTTNTAYAEMASGTCTLAGFGIVKQLDGSGKAARCTPLTFGVPDLLGMFG